MALFGYLNYGTVKNFNINSCGYCFFCDSPELLFFSVLVAMFDYLSLVENCYVDAWAGDRCFQSLEIVGNSKGEVAISNLAAGMYIVKVTTDNAESFEKKIVKE